MDSDNRYNNNNNNNNNDNNGRNNDAATIKINSHAEVSYKFFSYIWYQRHFLLVAVIIFGNKISAPQMGSTQPKSVFEFEDQSLVGGEKHSLEEAPLRALYSGGANDYCPCSS